MERPVFQLSNYIAGFANAAASAQEVMSQGDSPMAIQLFRFKFNVAIDLERKGNSNEDVNCLVKPIPLKERMMMDFSEHLGIEIECTLVSTLGIAES